MKQKKIKKSWLNNKTILITGVSSGIGKQLTEVLIEKYNAKIFGVARREEKLLELKKKFTNQFNYYVADVTKLENWEKLLEYCKQEKIFIDILINNAGTIHNFLPLQSIDISTIERTLNTNFYSAIYGMKVFYEMIKMQSGGIINICSGAALASLPGLSIYCGSKSALSSTTLSFAREVPKNIYIGIVYPGFIKTELFDNKDSHQGIFNEKDINLVNKFCMDLNKAANKIANKIHKKKRRSIIGFDSRVLNITNKICPTNSSNIIKGVMKISKRPTFKDIFSD